LVRAETGGCAHKLLKKINYAIFMIEMIIFIDKMINF